MDFQTFIHSVVIVCMILIFGALGSGLYYLVSGRNNSTQIAKALTVRIILSLVLFGFLFFAFAMGWIHPHSL